MFRKGWIILVIFLLGWSAHLGYSQIIPLEKGAVFPLGESGIERTSPNDWVKEDQIRVYPNGVTLDLSNAVFTSYADTNSMDPLLDKDTNGIEMRPIKEKLQVGDIVSYHSSIVDAVIVHRIIEIGKDSRGTYYIVKGDNNSVPDPERVRFEQMEGVVVALIY